MRSAIIFFCFLVAGNHAYSDTEVTTSPSKKVNQKELVSVWSSSVPLLDKQVLEVELRLYADKSAIWVEKIYKNWGHYNNKRKPVEVTEQAGTYKEITRVPSEHSTVGDGEPFIEVTVVDLKIGDWEAHHGGDRKGNSIMRYERGRYAATLMLFENP